MTVWVLSIDFAQSTEIPNRTDQDGQLYFLSPLTVGLFGVTDEIAEEHATFLMQETRTMNKNGNSVACMVLDFLQRRKYFFDELIASLTMHLLRKRTGSQFRHFR